MPPVPPRQGGGDAYPSGTPPYGMPSDPAFSRAGTPPQGPQSGGTPGADAGAGDEPKSTETTLTTRIKINIPGSRPIPPVVVREPMGSAGAAQGTQAADGSAAAAPSRRHRAEAPGSPVLGVMDSGSQPSVPPDLPPEWRTPAAAQEKAPAQEGSGSGGGSSWFAPRKKLDTPAAPDADPRPNQGIAAPEPPTGPTSVTPDARPAGQGGGAPFAPAGPGTGGTAPFAPAAGTGAFASGTPGRPASPGSAGPDGTSTHPGTGAFAPGAPGRPAGPGAGGADAFAPAGTGAFAPGSPGRPAGPGGDPFAPGPAGPDGTSTHPGARAFAPGAPGRPAGPGAGGDPFAPGAEGASAARRSGEPGSGPATQAFPAVGADLGSPGATQTHGSGINPFAPEAGAFPPAPAGTAPVGAGGGATPFPPSAGGPAPQGVYAPKPKVGGARPPGMNGGLAVNAGPATAPATAPAPVETTARLRPVGDGFAGGTGGAGAAGRPEPRGAEQAQAQAQAKAAAQPKPPSRTRKLAGYGVGAVVLVGGIAYGAGLMMNQADVPRGTTVLGTAIGGDTRDQAVHTLDGTLGKLAVQPIQLSIDGRQLTLNPEVAGLTMDTAATVAQVTHHSYNPVTVLQSLLGNSTAVAPVVEIDRDKLRSALSRLAASGSSREGSIHFTAAGKVVATMPKSGSGLDVDAAVALVERAYQNRAAGAKDGTVNLPVSSVKAKSTAASTNQAAQTLGKWAMQSTFFHVKAGSVNVPFGPHTFSLALTLRPDDSGAFVPVFDLGALKAAYGSKFDAAKVNGKAVTAQQVAEALTTLLTKPNGPTSITLK